MATLSKDDYKKYVSEIQRYLRALGYYDERIPPVSIDGMYNPETAAAIEAFQSISGLPVTGEVDKPTFDALVEEYGRIFGLTSPALRINGFPDNEKILVIGNTGYDVYLLQVMLKALSDRYDNIYSVEIDGVYSPATDEAVNAVKRASQIDSVGTDKQTWDAITLLYNNL